VARNRDFFGECCETTGRPTMADSIIALVLIPTTASL
jgi:hypothetical protein